MRDTFYIAVILLLVGWIVLSDNDNSAASDINKVVSNDVDIPEHISQKEDSAFENDLEQASLESSQNQFSDDIYGDIKRVGDVSDPERESIYFSEDVIYIDSDDHGIESHSVEYPQKLFDGSLANLIQSTAGEDGDREVMDEALRIELEVAIMQMQGLNYETQLKILPKDGESFEDFLIRVDENLGYENFEKQLEVLANQENDL